ncbi:MAG TPA: polyphosphate kinase 2 family protein [Acidimicrobiia bacterium]|nr:polyphosphate kinase 2 family protein [Acidimicrobiia bacterium]
MTTIDRYRVRPGERPDLGAIDTRDHALVPEMDKDSATQELKRCNRRLSELQHLLWADGSRSMLLVLQAMDTGGKDGTIRRVFSGVNPQGVDVVGFGVPSEAELAHDYLWRVHTRIPAKGRIAIFNRSHYEDVLVVRVEELVPERRWRPRFSHIRDFERMLVDEGTVIRKVMLHISKDEQRERLEARLEDPTKGYKFNPSDLDTRARWDDYMDAYADALGETSTEAAPWYVVPSDRKWYRNLVVSRILIDALESVDLSYPEPDVDLSTVVIE